MFINYGALPALENESQKCRKIYMKSYSNLKSHIRLFLISCSQRLKLI